MASVQRDDDAAKAGVDGNRDKVLLRCRSGSGGWRRVLCKRWSGDEGEQSGGKESLFHRHAHSKAGVDAATEAFPLTAKSL
jgi:hypothetical protein